MMTDNENLETFAAEGQRILDALAAAQESVWQRYGPADDLSNDDLERLFAEVRSAQRTHLADLDTHLARLSCDPFAQNCYLVIGGYTKEIRDNAVERLRQTWFRYLPVHPDQRKDPRFTEAWKLALENCDLDDHALRRNTLWFALDAILPATSLAQLANWRALHKAIKKRHGQEYTGTLWPGQRWDLKVESDFVSLDDLPPERQDFIARRLSEEYVGWDLIMDRVGLSEQKQTILWLYHVENWKEREIAEAVGTTYGAVRKAVHDAHNKIRDAIPPPE